MSRPVYLVVYPSPLFPAHWALWLPYYTNGSEGSVGKYINIEGDPATGFSLDIRRSYDLTTEPAKKSLILLCWVDARHISDEADPWSPNSNPVDAIEKGATSVQPPEKSLRSAGTRGASGPGSRVELKNCQTWLRDVVVLLAGDGTFPNEAIQVLDQAPRN
ncbi:hypothetical protein V492_05545 [Pseudogymnoascus sp. VKM F-4246]|nr:hypothetical protein V492_05545 [Pseudogymnoascus sp. VKM F-4246]